jgi:lysozyme family protein
MAEFAPAFERTMKFEDDPHEPGRVTREPSGCRARFGINEDAHPEMAEVFWTEPADEARLQAENVYARDYWNALRLGLVHDQDLASKIFDMAVNFGQRHATVYVQRGINFLFEVGGSLGRIAVDGEMGPETLEHLNAVNADALLRELKNLSRAHYEHVAAANPGFAPWLEGSVKRAMA